MKDKMAGTIVKKKIAMATDELNERTKPRPWHLNPADGRPQLTEAEYGFAERSYSRLKEAIERGNPTKVKRWMKANPTRLFVGKEPCYGATGMGPLAYACICGHRILMSVGHVLFKYFQDVGIQDSLGRNVIHTAAIHGGVDSLEFILNELFFEEDFRAGVEKALSAKDQRGYTPLHLAALYGHLEMVRALLKRGVCINPRDNEGRTPFLVAAAFCHVDIVNLLHRYGADLHAKDGWGFNAIITTMLREERECDKMPLTEPQPDHTDADQTYETLVALRNMGADGEARDNCGRTPYHFAALWDCGSGPAGFTNDVAGLWKVDVFAKCNLGQNALFYAAMRTDYVMAIDRVQGLDLLRDYPEDPDLMSDMGMKRMDLEDRNVHGRTVTLFAGWRCLEYLMFYVRQKKDDDGSMDLPRLPINGNRATVAWKASWRVVLHLINMGGKWTAKDNSGLNLSHICNGWIKAHNTMVASAKKQNQLFGTAFEQALASEMKICTALLKWMTLNSVHEWLGKLHPILVHHEEKKKAEAFKRFQEEQEALRRYQEEQKQREDVQNSRELAKVLASLDMYKTGGHLTPMSMIPVFQNFPVKSHMV